MLVWRENGQSYIARNFGRGGYFGACHTKFKSDSPSNRTRDIVDDMLAVPLESRQRKNDSIQKSGTVRNSENAKHRWYWHQPISASCYTERIRKMLAEEMHYPACAFPTQVTGGTWSSNFISSQKLPVSNNDLRQAHNGRRQYFIRNGIPAQAPSDGSVRSRVRWI